MNRLLLSQAPFPIDGSSCSNRFPIGFRYKRCRPYRPGPLVLVDTELEKVVRKKESHIRGSKILWMLTRPIFGWFCESREIQPSLYEILSDINNVAYLRTIGLKSVFTCDSELISVAPDFYYYNPNGSNLPWVDETEYGIYEKTKNISMVCSNSRKTYGHVLRLEVAGELKDRIDLFGGAHGSPRIGDPKPGYVENLYTWRSKLPALKDYRFSIVFENAQYDKYYTEKVTDCFATGTVPVYWGTRRISEDFDARGIIFWEELDSIDKLTPERYKTMLPYVEENLIRVKQLRSADDQLFYNIQRFR